MKVQLVCRPVAVCGDLRLCINKNSPIDRGENQLSNHSNQLPFHHPLAHIPRESNGNLLFLAGQGPFDSNGERVGATFGDQARATFDNLELVANAAGTSLKNVLRIGVYLSSLDDFD